MENIALLQSILDELPPTNPLRRLKGEIYFEANRMNSLFQNMKTEDWSVEKILKAIDDYLADLTTREGFVYQRPNPKLGIKVGDPKQDKLYAEKKKMELLKSAAQLFPVYQKKMLALNRYDYADMILWVVKAFREDENLLRNYQERYLYFLVDEFQDTNGAQNEILKSLTNYWEKPNCFTVGDDDQSIYEFQGARVKNILDFYEANKNEIKYIVLTENYRSNQPILNAAKALIENNEDRLVNKIPGLDKSLTAAHPKMSGSFIEPRIVEYPNPTQENAGIIRKVKMLREQGVALSEIAVLYHRHAQAANLIELFEKKNIPYSVKRKINILDLPLVQNILTTLRYISEETRQPHSGEYRLFEMMHYHFFKIRPRDVAALAAYASSKRDVSWREIISEPNYFSQIKLRDPEALLQFEKNITKWISNAANLTLQMLFEEILNDSGLLVYILKHDEKIWLMQVLNTFFDFLKDESAKHPRIRIHEFLEMIEKMEANGIPIPLNKTVFAEEGVNFITAHSAKGLEFQYVFLMGCTADKWEKSRKGGHEFTLPDTLTYTRQDNIDESLRRLFYVAMTRAKEHLIISYHSSDNGGKNLEKSKFVAEVMEGARIKISAEQIDQDELFELSVQALQKNRKPVIELYDHDFLKSRVEGISMSASLLNKYLKCPVSFYFENVLRVPSAKNDSMAFGNAIHWALRRLFDKMKESGDKKFPSVQDVINDFRWEMNRQKDSFTDKQFTNRLLQGELILPVYYNEYLHTWNKIVVTEYPIRNIETDGIPVNGKLDKIEFIGNDVNVVDYKTGNVQYAIEKLSAPSEKNPKGGDYWRQIIFYKILLDNYRREKWNMISGEIDFIEKDEKKMKLVKEKIMVTPDSISFVKDQLKDSYNKIQQLEFSEGCGEEDCHWCNFVRNNELEIATGKLERT